MKRYKDELTLDEYQFAAMRTYNAATARDGLLNCGLGLCGESGEVAELIKKHVFHGHELDKERICKELGDVLWYVATLADSLDIDLEYVARSNITKLESRYPSGFSKERSKER